MTVPLTGALEGFVDEQVALHGYETRSAYILDLLQKERDREHLRGLLLEGLRSPGTMPADAAYFESLRALARGHPNG